MDIRTDKTAFLRGLTLAKAVADHRSPMMPILGHVLLRAEGKDRLSCAATDLNVSVVHDPVANVRKDGAIALGAKPLHDIVKGLPDGEVALRLVDHQRAEIRAGKAHFTIVGLPPGDFPKLPSAESAPFQPVEPKTLAGLIGTTAFCCSTDETRPHLCGVLLETTDGIARMVATDGHRLAKAEATWNGGPAFSPGVVVPRKGLVEIARLLDGADGACQVAMHEGVLFARVGPTTLSVRLADVQFPPWEQVVPKENGTHLLVSRVPLLDALRRVSLMAPGITLGVKLDFRRGRLRLSAEDADLGEGHEDLDVAYDGTPLTVGFNARYLVELLDAMACERVRLDLDGELDPAVLRPEGADEYLGVVMPMRM